MEEPTKVLMSILTDIQSAIQAETYAVAARHASSLINLAYHLQSKKDVFLGDVLESICMQIHDALTTHEVTDHDKGPLHDILVDQMSKLMTAYTGNNKNVYGELIDMRYAATTFLHLVDIKYDYKPPE